MVPTQPLIFSNSILYFLDTDPLSFYNIASDRIFYSSKTQQIKRDILSYDKYLILRLKNSLCINQYIPQQE